MTGPECRFAREFTVRAHDTKLDKGGICGSCASILARIRACIAAGAMSPPISNPPAGASEPKPVNALADCAACGERFNAVTNQRAYLGVDLRWRFVHET